MIKIKQNAIRYTIEILPLSDDGEYGLIIGVPDVKIHNLQKLASQAIDTEVNLDAGG